MTLSNEVKDQHYRPVHMTLMVHTPSISHISVGIVFEAVDNSCSQVNTTTAGFPKPVIIAYSTVWL